MKSSIVVASGAAGEMDWLVRRDGAGALVRGDVLIRAQLRCLETGVKGVGDVRLPAPDTEV